MIRVGALHPTVDEPKAPGGKQSRSDAMRALELPPQGFLIKLIFY